jgi:hypothetical protein
MTVASTQDITAAIASQLGAILTGWTVYDLSTTPDAIDTRAGPVLFPEKRGGFMGGFNIEVMGTYGTEGTRAMNFTYTLKYTFCYAPIGADRDIAANSGVEDALKTLLLAAVQRDALGSVVPGVNEFLPVDVEDGEGHVNDYDGNPFFGYTLKFQVMELIN